MQKMHRTTVNIPEQIRRVAMSRAAEIGVYSFSETARRALQVWEVAQFRSADMAAELRAWHTLDEPSVDNSAAMANILAEILDALGEPNVMDEEPDDDGT